MLVNHTQCGYWLVGTSNSQNRSNTHKRRYFGFVPPESAGLGGEIHASDHAENSEVLMICVKLLSVAVAENPVVTLAL